MTFHEAITQLAKRNAVYAGRLAWARYPGHDIFSIRVDGDNGDEIIPTTGCSSGGWYFTTDDILTDDWITTKTMDEMREKLTVQK